MSICDLTIATGGSAMVKAAYSSGKPAYGVGAGNATVVVDETADIEEAAMNTRISKVQNHGSGCSCDGNLLVESSVYDRFLAALQQEGGYLATAEATTDGGFRVVEHNCAIVAVARRYGQACASEIDFIRAVLPGARVERVSHIVEGARHCGYDIRPA